MSETVAWPEVSQNVPTRLVAQSTEELTVMLHMRGEAHFVSRCGICQQRRRIRDMLNDPSLYASERSRLRRPIQLTESEDA